MFQEIFNVKDWQPAHADEVSYPADFTSVETPPAPPAAGTDPQNHLAYRFAEIQAHDGDLVFARKHSAGTAPTYGTGQRRVFQGTSRIIQLAPGDTLYVGGVDGAVHGSVIWGR